MKARQHKTPSADTEPLASGGTRTRHVVVGFDGSVASYDALAFAAGWANRIGVQLDVVYVHDALRHWTADASGAVMSVTPALEPQIDMSGEAAEAMSAYDLQWAYVAATGGVAEQLEWYGKHLRADAIIIGRSHKRLHMLRSSTSRRLLSCADRIVIVVP